MIIREDAIALCKELKNKPLSEWAYGKDKCQGYGVDGLVSYLEYNPEGIKDNKNTNGSPLNAVVVTTWRGKNIAPVGIFLKEGLLELLDSDYEDLHGMEIILSFLEV